jgi:hypothetical protein
VAESAVVRPVSSPPSQILDSWRSSALRPATGHQPADDQELGLTHQAMSAEPAPLRGIPTALSRARAGHNASGAWGDASNSGARALDVPTRWKSPRRTPRPLPGRAMLRASVAGRDARRVDVHGRVMIHQTRTGAAPKRASQRSRRAVGAAPSRDRRVRFVWTVSRVESVRARPRCLRRGRRRRRRRGAGPPRRSPRLLGLLAPSRLPSASRRSLRL